MNSQTTGIMTQQITCEDLQVQPTLQTQERASQQQNLRRPIQRHYGSMLPFRLDQNYQPKYVLGPHYYVFLPTLIICIWFIVYSLRIYKDKLNMGLFPLLLCGLSALFFIVSYLRVGISNPGIASSYYLPNIEIRSNPKYCKPCRVLKEGQTCHCYYCDVCIQGMDHHCPWVGKCIGKNNMKLFKIFIFSVIWTLTVFSLCIYFFSVARPLQIK